MRQLRLFKEIPKLPFSALIFYLGVWGLWQLGVIPSPREVVTFLESLYSSYGLIGLSIATFLEGIVYLGLYFPGSFIIVLAVFFSDGSFSSLLAITLVIAATLTVTSFINYFLGRHVVFRQKDAGAFIRDHSRFSKGLFLSMLHPNLLSFYFFHVGLERQKLWKVIFVPLVIIPYFFIFASVIFAFKTVLKSQVENPYVMFILIILWIVVAFIADHLAKRRKRRLHGQIK